VVDPKSTADDSKPRRTAFAVVGGGGCRYNSAVTETFVLKELPGECAMDHELREKCQDLITRIKHLQDSL
jgi:hypothetical protein